MKKFALTLAATAVALASANVTAKPVYEDSSMVLDITGEVAWEIRRDEDKDDATEFRLDDVSIEVKPQYILDNGLEFYGFMEFLFSGQTDQNFNAIDSDDEAAGIGYDKKIVGDAYVAVVYGGLEVRIGDQDYSGDHFGVDEHKDAPVTRIIGQDDADAGSDEVLVVEFENDSMFLSGSYDIPEGDEDAKDENSISLYAEGYVGDATIGAVVNLYDQDGEGGAGKAELAYGLSAMYDYDDFLFGAEVSVDANDDTDNELAYLAIVEYDISGDFDVAVGFGQIIYDTADTLTAYYVNADYDLHKDVDLYAEVYATSADDSQVGYVLGLSLDF